MPVPLHPRPTALAAKGQRADLRAIFDSNDPETLGRRLSEIARKWEDRRPAVAERIDEEITDALACFCFPRAHRKRISTTNCLERLNQEMKRRTRVARIFPDPASALRLIATLAMEQNEDRDRRYLDMSLLDVNGRIILYRFWPDKNVHSIAS